VRIGFPKSVAALALLFCVGLASAAEPNDQVFAYYYPWYYKGDWTRHKYVGTPQLGEYGSDDPIVAEKHIDWASEYGIDGFWVSWWGYGSLTDQMARRGLMRARNLNQIRFAIYYEAFGMLDPVDGTKDGLVDFSKPAVLHKMIADLAHIKNDFFWRDSYQRIDGKPVVALYVTRSFRNFTRAHIAAAEAAIGEDLYIVGDEAFIDDQASPETAQNPDVFDAYHAYNMFEDARVKQGETTLSYMQREAVPVYRNWAEKTTFMPGLMPSYHDFRGNKPLKGTAQEFAAQIEMMKKLPYKRVSNHVDRIFLVTSFNEWWEGTTLEPTKEYGTSYLRVIRDNFGVNEGAAPLKITALSRQAPGPLHQVFKRQVDVFGLKVYIADNVDDDTAMHVAAVLAQYLDNNGDAVPDNEAVLASLRKASASIALFQDGRAMEWQFEKLAPVLRKVALHPVPADTVVRSGNRNGGFDAALSEVLKLVTQLGYAYAYPRVFGEKRGTAVARAMDKARGGTFIRPPRVYPDNAWYRRPGLGYDGQITDYMNLGILAMLEARSPAQHGRISAQWPFRTAAELKAGDRLLYQLLTTPEYAFPSVLPDGRYVPRGK
jgi:hypothetical protein